MPTTAVWSRPTAAPSAAAEGTSINLTRRACISGTILSRLLAEASLDLNGRPMHVQVEAEHLTEAIDLLVDRLRRRLVDSEDRHRSRRRDPGPDPQDG